MQPASLIVCYLSCNPDLCACDCYKYVVKILSGILQFSDYEMWWGNFITEADRGGDNI